ncbi:olfactory receptor 10A7-like [Hemicordylus capensis]|uniref:olfactory receptor 10A7-like n=1 Tax=Hemicordylus capensis TaxID=884348 RepID=UPI002302D7B2|nr:olfactory receptor 10A7-like [Hemicordylus capensis]
MNVTSITYFIFLGFPTHLEVQILMLVLLSAIYTVTITGNCLIIFITWVDITLHTPMYFFLRVLSFLEICYTSVTLPQMLYNLLTEDKSISFSSCAVQMYFILFLGTVECFLLASMSYDRYTAICLPLHYTVFMSREICIQLTLASWLCGILIPLMNTSWAFSLPYCGPNEINHFFCDFPPVLKLACADTTLNEVVMLVSSLLITLIPFVFILASYTCILGTILRMPSSTKRQKVFSTCSSHLILVILFYGTASFMYLQPKSNYSLKRDKIISLFYTVLTPMLNPIIYSLRNTDVRMALRKILKRKILF